MVFKHQDGLEFLKKIDNDSVDLILTDPPYITSRDSGMNKWVEHVARQDKKGAPNFRTMKQWRKLKTLREWIAFLKEDESIFMKIKDEGAITKKTYKPKAIKGKLLKYRKDFLKYGSIYGKKYAVTTDYGEWDCQFTLEELELFMKQFYLKLRDGGTCIVFFDSWKITNLKEIMESCAPDRIRGIPKKKKETESEEEFELRKKFAIDNPIIKSGFEQIRLVQWIKTNPQPINSSVNYLTNCREIALLGIKKSKPTFNSKYDKGIYEYPLQGGKDRFHPTQKSLPLFEDLIRKHSNEGDVVLDCFAGSATTAIAAINTNRRFTGCESNKEYFSKAEERIERCVSETLEKCQAEVKRLNEQIKCLHKQQK